MNRQFSTNSWHPRLAALGLGLILLCGCSPVDPETRAGDPTSEATRAPETAITGENTQAAKEVATDEPTPATETVVADVISVQTTGQANAYQFSVGISSPDGGCEQYVNWWEVLTEEGDLLYRRTLGHSHVNEQPFVRSGGPVPIGPDTVVLLRAHMHPGGYGGRAMWGSVSAGFDEIELDPGFAAEVETISPQPTGCAF